LARDDTWADRVIRAWQHLEQACAILRPQALEPRDPLDLPPDPDQSW
jgi:hypothetical protein